MTMKKYAQGEDLEVFRGEEAVVVNKHMAKTGKSVTDFDDNERKALWADLGREETTSKEKPAEPSDKSE